MSTFTELYLQAALAGELGDKKFVRVVLDLSERAKGPKILQRDPGRIHNMLAQMGPRAQRVMDAAVDIERAWAVNTDVCLRFPIEFITELRGMPEIRSIRPARRHVTQLDETLLVHEILEPLRSALTGRGVRIAILDSGIDLNHPDLKGRVDLNASRNFSSEGAPHYVNDMNGHGTHVAGIIAGNGPTYRGVAPDAQLVICKIFDHLGTAEEGRVDLAVQHAIAQGVDLINYSGGFAPIINGKITAPPPWVWPADESKEERAFRMAARRGILGVVSAGNYGAHGPGTISMPGTSMEVLTVGSTGHDKVRSSFSSFGPIRRSKGVAADDIAAFNASLPETKVARRPKPDLAAVGGEVSQGADCYHEFGVVGLRADAVAATNPCVIGNHIRMAGTSQAAPIVTGMAALAIQGLRERAYQDVPERTQAWTRLLRGLLRHACSTAGGDKRCGNGVPSLPRLDVLVGDVVAGRLRPAQLR